MNTRLRHSKGRPGPQDTAGAALLLAFLVLIVIIAIVYQIYTVTQTDARITRNELTRAQMDLALQAVMLQVYEDLKEDALAAQASDDPAGGAAPDAGAVAPPTADGETGEPERNPDGADSQFDNWYTPQSTNFGDIQIRIFVRDENSKYNVLNMLNEDEEVAEEAFRVVSTILDNAREGTDFDIGPAKAEELATAMLEHMRDRRDSDLPRPLLLTESEESENAAVPFSFKEFRALEAFDEGMFEDVFGQDDERVHGIQAFLTIFTSPAVGPEEGGNGIPQGTGGFGVNINTAPLAVLAALKDEREFSFKIWDEILEYRNIEEEPVESEEEGVEDVEPEPMLDEFGEELIQKQIFDSLDELEEVFEYKALQPPEKARINEVLQTTSDVFEIVLAARISTSQDAEERLEFDSRREQEEYFRSGEHLVRIARSVVWRRATQDDVEIVPLIPWEIIDNAPLLVLDYPDDER